LQKLLIAVQTTRLSCHSTDAAKFCTKALHAPRVRTAALWWSSPTRRSSMCGSAPDAAPAILCLNFRICALCAAVRMHACVCVCVCACDFLSMYVYVRQLIELSRLLVCVCMCVCVRVRVRVCECTCSCSISILSVCLFHLFSLFPLLFLLSLLSLSLCSALLCSLFSLVRLFCLFRLFGTVSYVCPGTDLICTHTHTTHTHTHTHCAHTHCVALHCTEYAPDFIEDCRVVPCWLCAVCQRSHTYHSQRCEVRKSHTRMVKREFRQRTPMISSKNFRDSHFTNWKDKKKTSQQIAEFAIYVS
jgi:hypothetical protein